jgi:hypothetical protein
VLVRVVDISIYDSAPLPQKQAEIKKTFWSEFHVDSDGVEAKKKGAEAPFFHQVD